MLDRALASFHRRHHILHLCQTSLKLFNLRLVEDNRLMA